MSFARNLVDLDDRFSKMQPELEVTVRDDDLGFEGHVVVWNTGISAGGPLALSGKGGNRITPTVSIDEVRMLAKIMAIKNAAAGLPLGGAKSGLRTDPGAANHEFVYRSWVRQCRPFLHENGGKFGGFGFDIGARPEHPHWACDELGSRQCFTGKPLDMGGTDYDREGIAGYGVAVAAEALLAQQGSKSSNARFAVQGAGAMGAAVIRYFSGMGGQLAAVSDPRLGGSYTFDRPPSIALLDALAHQKWEISKELIREEASQNEDPTTVFQAPVDVLFPCAVHDVINETTQSQITASIICEGANSPCTTAASAALEQRGVVIAPDFLVNSGGIIAAFVELTTANQMHEGHERPAIAKRDTQVKIARNVKRAFAIAQENGSSFRDASRYLALSRIFGMEELTALEMPPI